MVRAGVESKLRFGFLQRIKRRCKCNFTILFCRIRAFERYLLFECRLEIALFDEKKVSQSPCLFEFKVNDDGEKWELL